MKYYFGKGTELNKEECKEYKTLENARKAFDKAVEAGETVTVWDENGAVVIGLTDIVPEGALQDNPDGSVNTYDAEGNNVGTISAEEAAELTGESGENNAGASTTDENEDGQGNEPLEQEKEQDGAKNEPQNTENEVIVPEGKMKVTVICDGTLNLRRTPHWGNGNVCGRAARGQSYYVKEIHTIDGKKMVRTIDDLYLSGASEHVQFEQL